MKDNVITVYSMEGCASCVAASKLLARYSIPHKVIKIDEDFEAWEFLKSKGHRTMPQLYVGDKLFVEAGYMGLVKMSEEEIRRLLYGDSQCTST